MGHAGLDHHLADRHTGRTHACDHDFEVGHLLVDDLERVLECSHDHDRGAVLVVVEDRDVERFLELILDVEALRRCDVLEVDAAVDRGDALDRLDGLLGRVRVEADRERVDARELLEEQGLALHDRERCLGADVAQAEHRGAVGDDGDGVLLDGVVVGQVGLGLDRLAHAGDARRVRHRQVVAVTDRAQRQDLDLAALVHLEGAVLVLEDLDTVEVVQGVEDHLLVLGALAVDDDVLVEGRQLGLEPLERCDVPAGLADGYGDPPERPGYVVEPGTDAD